MINRHLKTLKPQEHEVRGRIVKLKMEAISNLSATMHNMQSADEPNITLDE